MSKEEIEVYIKYMGIEKSIKGDTNLVIRELFKFFSDIVPPFELIAKLTLTVDLEQLLKACQKIFSITEEGLITTVQTEKLSDKELLLLHLARSKLGYHLGKSDRDSNSAIPPGAAVRIDHQHTNSRIPVCLECRADFPG